MKKITLGLFLSLLAIGCTEDKAEKQVLKYEVYPKGMIGSRTTNYLYVPSTLTASRHSEFGRAFTLGEERIVRLELGEFNLNIYAIDKEKKFEDNPSNKKLIMSIPVEHVDYRCQDDAFGECTSEEVENERIPWNQKKYFIPKFEETKFTDLNFLPSEIPDDCFKVKESKLLSRKLEPNAINFRLERGYQTELFFFCSRGIEDLQDFNWSDVSHYSLVKLDEVASPDYKTAVYNPDWINTFGFFEENDSKLDVDGSQTQATQIKYINRWNPNRQEIVYNLTPEFNKPENAVIKAATVESFKRMNESLRTAGAKFQMRLQEPQEGIDVGDLRHSHLILAEDPFEASVIGYGPAVTNPNTGEIISARTVMYLGSLKRFIRYTYDEIVLEHKKSLSIATINQESSETEVSEQSLKDFNKVTNLLSKSQTLSMIKEKQKFELLPSAVDRTPFLNEADMDRAADLASRQDRIMKLAKQGMYPAELLDFGDVSQEVIAEIVQKIGALEPWETLTAQQKQSVIDVLAPYTWVPTLIHEIGHNLGLRHNFAGSEDKDHFYSNEELKNMNVPVSAKNVPYSSIMDYPKSEINALRTFGKYDIAALRFAYTNTVLTADNKLIQVDSAKAPPEGLKDFSYCTDDGVEPNPNCNPFDEGTGMKEIAQSLIDSYKDGYLRSNFRRGRAQFSGFDDDMYLGRVNRTFKKLRLMYERYEDLVNKFQLDQKQIDEIPWIKELDEAVVIAADFMMDVIAEPDTLCVIQGPDGLQVAPIDTFPEFTHNSTRECSLIELNPPFVVVGQGGKPLNSFKLPSNPNRYADQIDVRGTWIDKTLAMRTLFRRTMNSTIHDDFNGNFMDHPKVAAKLADFVEKLMNNELTGRSNFRFIDGSEQNVPVRFSIAEPAYEIRKSELPIPNRIFGLQYDNMMLIEALNSVIKRGLNEGSSAPSSLSLQKALTVHSRDPEPGTGKYIGAEVGNKVLFVSKENSLSFGIMTKMRAVQLLSQTDPAVVEKVAALIAEKGDPSTLTADERRIYDLGEEMITQFVEGSLSSADYYSTVLLSLL